MKRTALLITAALMVSPVFAAEDLCRVNLQKIEDNKATNPILGDPLKQQVADLESEAKKYQAAGDLEKCASSAQQALTLLEKQNTEGGGEGTQ
ncbi:hypothetical protein [Pseudomonas mangiferae]|uniref:DUF1090 domain-containing protein n=1 Tax=Pseudomonas mangiferae TaxID=2593654 RepID=A0A553GXB2_9PSED|nr:hypothetical protein [Pseudomonas mangiferae]TRX74139.1 hypothetical protein FM069_13450 [Pseudomonas mangiferae]